MLDRIMVEHAFGTKLTFHRNAPFEASLEPDVLESAGKCGKVRESAGKTSQRTGSP